MSKPRPKPDDLPYRPCVGIMVLNAQGLVWLGRRGGAPDDAEGQGQWWQMPQGGIDADEDPRQAALRELQEETGMRSARIIAEHPDWLTYELPSHLVGRAWGGRYRGQRQKWFALRFEGSEAEIDIGNGVHGQPPEFEAWRWAQLSDLVNLIVPFKRDVYGLVTKAFSDIAKPLR